MLDGPYKVDGARQGSHNPRASLEGYFSSLKLGEYVVVGDLRMV